MQINKNNALNYLVLFVISLLSLGYQDHSIYPGLDGSYFWAFNYLISFQPQDLDKIIFIYGPMAFLHYTVGYGYLILIGIAFQVIIKFVLGYCFIKVCRLLEIHRNIGFVLFGLSCLTMFSPEAYFNLIIILFLVIYHLEHKFTSLIFIAILTGFGYYYKCSAGLSAALLQFTFLFYTSVLNKKTDLKLIFKLFGINLIAWFIIGLIIFRGIAPVFGSLVTYYQNIIAFNETSSVYNQSDSFILLAGCGLSLIAIFFINKDHNFKLFWLLSLLFLYTGYTHSMVRMHYSHYIGFLLYLLLIVFSCALFYRTMSRFTIPLLALAFFCYYGNIGSKRDYSDLLLSIHNGPKNFTNYVLRHNKEKARAMKQTTQNLAFTSKLDYNSLNEINKGSVDFFPWDLSFVEANHLNNWKPRPYLQNLNMSAYFDKRTADYFASKDAPEYLVWHGSDPFDFLNGIDNSYLLNNEFHSALSIFSNYSAIRISNNGLVLKRRSRPIKISAEDMGTELEVKSGEWINIPQNPSLMGCSIEYDFNVLRSLKKLAYRDDEFFIEYCTANNIRTKRRIWPGDAKEFTWLDPVIGVITDTSAYKNYTRVRFTNTNRSIHSGKLKIRFKTLKFEGDESKKALYKWFNGAL